MTNEHDSATTAATSLLENGEVCLGAKVTRQLLCEITVAQWMPVGVVGDSMFGKERRREDGRSLWIDHPSGCQREVRALVVAQKQSNFCGSKGGRKANV